MTVPEHVLSAFQLGGLVPTPAGPQWDNGARFGRIVVSPAGPTSAWAAKVREGLSMTGLRVARPVRATDGRFVVGGFRASEFAEGKPASRVDEAIAAALVFDAAMAGAPALGVERTDAWAEAERTAWRGAQVPGPTQVAHADFLFTCIFSGSLPPTLTEIVPTAEERPVGYTAALALVDGLLTRSVDDRVIARWAHVPNIQELSLRALDYRQALVERVASNIGSELSRVRRLLVSD
ncbi:hypothetical protein CAPI_02415 [Corynebacterium capitovis DSM 44611]|uniref:hypothetical protein n=1 Tax=Corynebacterium capitovis TaxID=131081 RepID=UPI00036FEFBC|nr:hypothetical protein [Corynebacterium capitovis]WKD57057.1 hypothetical protein CAPI_02415 [Corynebacterium capitovis DSM 44611]